MEDDGMAWMREECSASDAELLERLVGRLEMCLKAFPRSGVTAVLDDDDVVTVWDEGGTTASFWYKVSPGEGLRLHFASPVCGVPQGDRTLFYERLLEPSGYEGPFSRRVENGQVSLVGTLPAEELTDKLVLHVARELLRAAKATTVSLVARFGVRPWHGDEVTETGTFWSLSEPEGSLDPVEQYRRTAFSRIRPYSVPERVRAVVLKNAHLRWMDLPEEDAGTGIDLPRNAHGGDPGDKFLTIDPRLERRLLGRLTSLLLDLDTLREFHVSRPDRRSFFLFHKDIVLETGFEPTLEGGVCLYCQAELCDLPAYPSDELYRSILSTAFENLPAKVWAYEDTVGVCGHLDSRFLTNESARHLLLGALALAEKVHNELTLGFGLKSLCRPEETTPPDSDTEDLFEED